MEDYKSILIIKMSSLGDILHALPTLHVLRRRYPSARIVWAVHEQFVSLLPGAPYIDEVVFIDKNRLKSFRYWRELRRQLHPYRFDLSIDLQGLAKSAVVAMNSGAKRKIGYWEMREGSFLVSKGITGPHKNGHVIERYLDVARGLDCPVDAVAFPLPPLDEVRSKMLQRLAADGLQGPFVALVPGARWSVKEWPLANWCALSARFSERGINVLLLGSGDDIEKGKKMKSGTASEHVFDYTGKTTLTELMALISLSSLYVSADTGPLHLANALKKELIALFGTTSPDRTGPYGGAGSDYIHLIVSPTSRATVARPLVDDPECMGKITVDTVWAECRKAAEKVGL